jgi:hypothetical protein
MQQQDEEQEFPTRRTDETERKIEKRPGSPGALRTTGGIGGPFEAPHDDQISK